LSSTRVTVSNINVTQALALRDQLITHGLVMHQDFEWMYVPPQYKDDWSSELSTPAQVHFDMIDPVLATFYRLKWVNDN
jgi:hypothetical protein